MTTGIVATAKAARTLSDILDRLPLSAPGARAERIREAFEAAEKLYGDRKHWVGLSLIDHILGVVATLLPFQPDEDAIVACIFHHVLDEGVMTPEEIEKQFGANVRSIVAGVNLLSRVSTANRRMSVEHLRSMLMQVADDPRVLLIILCDRSFLLTHLAPLPAAERRQICLDVLQLFAPVAARLGIYSLKHQLESRAFPVVYPVDAVRIAEQLKILHDQSGYFLESAAESLAGYLKSEGVKARVEGREKQLYSIFLKMRGKNINSVEDLYDLFALRVIVDDVAACYQALGLLHRVGHPVPNRFKDYIGFPKPNGYQSLHTTLVRLPGVPEHIFVEVQIRTEDMHREADFGIAAHWTYKEEGPAGAMQKAQIHRMLSRKRPLKDNIFVLTPKGDIIELPEGATPLDFAFHVHTSLGLSFRAARVNGSIVPLHHQLENGDVVDITRFKDPRPSPRWMALLKTASAKSRLKRYLALERRPQYVSLGRDILNLELARRGLPVLDSDYTLLRTVSGQLLEFSEREDILLKIGQGSQSAMSLIPHLSELKIHVSKTMEPAEVPAYVRTLGGMVAVVEGGIPMPVRYAKCCQPEEGPIIGLVSRTGEVKVHRASCEMLGSMNPERIVAVTWKSKLREER